MASDPRGHRRHPAEAGATGPGCIVGELGLTLRRGNEQSPVGRAPRRIPREGGGWRRSQRAHSRIGPDHHRLAHQPRAPGDAWDHLAGHRRRLLDPGVDGAPGRRSSALLVAPRPATCWSDDGYVSRRTSGPLNSFSAGALQLADGGRRYLAQSFERHFWGEERLRQPQSRRTSSRAVAAAR
jgi:hypothetical protein